RQEEETRLRRLLMTLMLGPEEQAVAGEAGRGVWNQAQPLDVMPDGSKKLSDKYWGESETNNRSDRSEVDTDTAKPLILCVDDDVSVLRLLKVWLSYFGYDVLTAESGEQAIETIKQIKPDCLLLDIVMPGMDGYDLCARLQGQEETANIPVIFLSSLDSEPDKARALALGAVDYVVKPFDRHILHDKVQACLQAIPRWQALQQSAAPLPKRSKPEDFWHFRDFLFVHLRLPPEKQELVAKVPPTKLYTMVSLLGIDESQIAQALAAFLKLPYLDRINPEEIRLGVLPAAYCRTHLVIAIHESSGENAFVLTNPFDLNLMDSLQRVSRSDQTLRLYVATPATLAPLLGTTKRAADQTP
ncbi:MAG TPA: response regulator, partial [Nitrospiraceae bacterium]|nr:response regulator [Nitrospiraceae bacterium]